MVDLKKYVCTVPFISLQLHQQGPFLCCEGWLKNHIPKETPLEEIWNSKEAIEVRKSMMDGSYRYCDKNGCPYLSQLINVGESGNIGYFTKVENLPSKIKKLYDNNSGYMEEFPEIFQYSYDKTCNYKCPTCRTDFIIENSDKIKEIQKLTEDIEILFANELRMLYLSGSADPFASVTYRNFLRNFDAKKYPKLESIHLHTNAGLWNKKMWDSMKNIHKYVTTCEISIDAATKYTYENITRLGGNWDTFIDNLKFINSIKKIKYVKTSFVVQSENYTEMKPFVDLMKSIFGKKVEIFFGRLDNWGTFDESMYKLKNVCDVNHPEHGLFKKELDKVWKDPQVFSNIHEYIDIKKTIF
jgi:hypothetical protein